MRGLSQPRAALPSIGFPEVPAPQAPAVDGGRSLRLRESVRKWLLTLEQEHETASHADPTELISEGNCHVCAGIEELWSSLKEAEAAGRRS